MQTGSHAIFLTGGTGYIGSRLGSRLLSRGHTVKLLTRNNTGSLRNLPVGCQTVLGNALEDGYVADIAPADTFVHLVGVSHPSPAKAAEFRSIDLKSLQVAVQAAQSAQIKHFVFISVAHPAPAMKAYIAIRQECERIIGASGLNATILRPWYVLDRDIAGHMLFCLCIA